jgi:hypothetical protein
MGKDLAWKTDWTNRKGGDRVGAGLTRETGCGWQWPTWRPLVHKWGWYSLYIVIIVRMYCAVVGCTSFSSSLIFCSYIVLRTVKNQHITSVQNGSRWALSDTRNRAFHKRVVCSYTLLYPNMCICCMHCERCLLYAHQVQFQIFTTCSDTQACCYSVLPIPMTSGNKPEFALHCWFESVCKSISVLV